MNGEEVLLRHLGRHGVPEEAAPGAADTDFRDRVTALTRTPDPLVQFRARFILDLVDHPEHRVTRTTWRGWLEHTALLTE